MQPSRLRPQRARDESEKNIFHQTAFQWRLILHWEMIDSNLNSTFDIAVHSAHVSVAKELWLWCEQVGEDSIIWPGKISFDNQQVFWLQWKSYKFIWLVSCQVWRVLQCCSAAGCRQQTVDLALGTPWNCSHLSCDRVWRLPPPESAPGPRIPWWPDTQGRFCFH